MKLLTLKPRVSEKSYALSELVNTYVFDVPAEFNKFDIAKAVTSQFEVKVVNVRISNVAGKPKRTVRRGRVSGSSKRTDIRKAYVTLAEGEKLPIFAAVEEANKAESPSTNAQGKGDK
jgi:large subunit ribosomal protein L23